MLRSRLSGKHSGFVRAIALLIALGLGAALAREPLTFHGLDFPDEIAGFVRGQHRDYETTNPGLGYSVAYRREGWTATVYVYDLGLRSIPDDPRSRVSMRNFEQAKEDVLAAQRQGAYRSAELKRDFLLPETGAPRLQCASFTLVRRDNNEYDSYLCVTAWRGSFVKLRLTGERHESNDAAAGRFMAAWMRLLWPQP